MCVRKEDGCEWVYVCEQKVSHRDCKQVLSSVQTPIYTDYEFLEFYIERNSDTKFRLSGIHCCTRLIMSAQGQEAVWQHTRTCYISPFLSTMREKEHDLQNWQGLSRAHLLFFRMFSLVLDWSKLSRWGSEHSTINLCRKTGFHLFSVIGPYQKYHLEI